MEKLKLLLNEGHKDFWNIFSETVSNEKDLSKLLKLAQLKKRAEKKISYPEFTEVKIAFLGGYTFFPIDRLLELMLFAHGIQGNIVTGDFDNYMQEILSEESFLKKFQPNIVVILPHPNPLTPDDADQFLSDILSICERANRISSANILLGNLTPSHIQHPGPWRSRNHSSQWNLIKQWNLNLSKSLLNYCHLVDLEFLSYRLGAQKMADPRSHFESKQLGSPAFLVSVASEISHLITMLYQAPKKVLVTDLDNTLWGGVLGDDGIEGVELGDTSPRGAAFRAFQKYLIDLKQTGTLLAIASKNEQDLAIEAIDEHPEMLLRSKDFVGIQAHWGPKSDSIKTIAEDLNLNCDSFVFVDDNPAEIEQVRQALPQVATVHLGEDPAHFIDLLDEKRFFEKLNLTDEDKTRTKQYKEESQRKKSRSSYSDLSKYLMSLEMIATVSPFTQKDLPRITQLINKTNQFNLTTRRRNLADVKSLANDPNSICLTMRLKDRFGDHGLISVMIGIVKDQDVYMDTWLMSCRVLQRGVEQTLFDQMVAHVRRSGYRKIIGQYIPTPKNRMVSSLYKQMGFQSTKMTKNESLFELDPADYRPHTTHIRIAKV